MRHTVTVTVTAMNGIAVTVTDNHNHRLYRTQCEGVVASLRSKVVAQSAVQRTVRQRLRIAREVTAVHPHHPEPRHRGIYISLFLSVFVFICFSAEHNC